MIPYQLLLWPCQLRIILRVGNWKMNPETLDSLFPISFLLRFRINYYYAHVNYHSLSSACRQLEDEPRDARLGHRPRQGDRLCVQDRYRPGTLKYEALGQLGQDEPASG